MYAGHALVLHRVKQNGHSSRPILRDCLYMFAHTLACTG